MELTWWGTAGFRIKTQETILLLDPYLSRNPEARPIQYLTPDNIGDGDMIFLSHGHFEHLLDVPAIAKKNGSMVFCSKEVGKTLLETGTKADKIQEITVDGFEIQFHGNRAQAFFSKHVVFDRKLVIKTLWQAKLRLFKHLDLYINYPIGQMLSWRFTIENKVVHFFGSGGSPAEEMEKLASRPTDILLVPLQGHSDICNIALEYVHVMQPKIVIPHYYDDFYPPISSMIDIEPFIKRVKQECPLTEVRTMELNETVLL
ncbi:MBL fold metallo-hydrolase [bacterium]|nr:MBL fold metallo-hydrolase [bacterium]